VVGVGNCDEAREVSVVFTVNGCSAESVINSERSIAEVNWEIYLEIRVLAREPTGGAWL
jgi:hypothetical protein